MLVHNCDCMRVCVSVGPHVCTAVHRVLWLVGYTVLYTAVDYVWGIQRMESNATQLTWLYVAALGTET